MKIYFILLLTLAYCGPIALEAVIGESCLKSSSFTVTSFSVSPWPFYINQNYTFSMTGTFESTELLDQLTVGTREGRSTWTYNFYLINQNYVKGTSTTFTYSNPTITKKGSYIDQITLHRPDYTIFGCWQFSFSI